MSTTLPFLKPCGCEPGHYCRECIDSAGPFDPRTEVSKDAQYIAGRVIKHLWIIFVLLPIVAVILYETIK